MRELATKVDRKFGADGMEENKIIQWKDVNLNIRGQAKCQLFRGNPEEGKLLQEVETPNVVMSWFTDALAHMQLVMFNSLGVLGIFGNNCNYTLGIMSGDGLPDITLREFVPNAVSNLYKPTDWASLLFPFTDYSNNVLDADTGAPLKFIVLSDYDQPESASEKTIPTCGIVASKTVANSEVTSYGSIGNSGFTNNGVNLRREAGYSEVIDKQTIKWVMDFEGADGAGTINSVHLAQGITPGTSLQAARFLLGTPVSKTLDDTFRVIWTFTRDLLPNEPA